ncbi:MAG: hypothetical protein K8T89_23455, partial [Planctomycetes bacterium]|nr:hypothetical protein [Planctomycetota bacterium]
MNTPRGTQRLLICLALCLLADGRTPLVAQKKKEIKDAPPQVIVAMPMTVEAGKTAKITLRGLRVDAVTEIRLHEPRSTGKLVGKAKKIPVPNNANPNQVGDSEIEIEVTLPKEVAGSTVPFSLIGPGGESKAHELIVRDGTPIVAEKEPNDGFRQAQAIVPPVIVEGKIQQSLDVDVFRFQGKKDEKYSIAVQANRFGSP